MKLLGFELTKSDELSTLRERLNELSETVSNYRAQYDFGIPLYGQANLLHSPYIVSLPRMYELAQASDIMQTIVSSITNETFRNGWEFEPKFARKCADCGMEYAFEPDECSNCGSTTLREPDYDEVARLQEFLAGEVNDNGQSFKEVLKQLEYDHCITDNAFTQLIKSYVTNEEGRVLAGKVNEIIRVHPALVTILCDDKGRLGYNEHGERLKFCLFHRDTVITDDRENCPKCGAELKRAFFKLNANTSDQETYYAPDEMKHTSEFHPSLITAPPIFLSVWQKIELLLNIDNYNRRSFGEERTPNKLLIVNTSSTSALERMLTWIRDQMGRYPNAVIPFGIEQREGQSGAPAQVISLVDKELLENNILLIQEARKQIGAVYGVSPVFLADVSTSGGLNNEGLQVTVTNRAVERAQAPYNDSLFKWLLRQYGVQDFVLRLKPSEEQDEASDEQLSILRAQRASLMLSMGFEVALDEKGEFEYSGEAQKPSSLTPTTNFAGFNEEFNPSGSPLELSFKKKKVSSEEELAREFERELEKLFKQVRLNEAKTPEEARERGLRLAEQLAERLRFKSKKLVRKIYEDSVGEVEKELNANILLDKTDDERINFLSENKELLEAFDNVRDALNQGTLEAVQRGYERGASIQNIVAELKEVVNASENKLESIARTEAQNINTHAREASYNKLDDGKYLFKWVNPLDNRTTKECRRITERTGKGVTLEQLKAIIREEAMTTYTPSRPFSPHINCRSNFVRVKAL